MQAGGAHRADRERRRSPLWMELFAPAVGRVDADVTFGAQNRQPRSRCRRTTRRYAGLGRNSGARPLEDSAVLRAPSAVGCPMCRARDTRVSSSPRAAPWLIAMGLEADRHRLRHAVGSCSVAESAWRTARQRGSGPSGGLATRPVCAKPALRKRKRSHAARHRTGTVPHRRVPKAGAGGLASAGSVP